VYFGKEGEQIVILLGGGTNSVNRTHQSAVERWERQAEKKQQKEKEGMNMALTRF
jgi:hypothetical protein